MTEYLDVVDEDDEVIGVDTREAVHAKHLIHRGVHVIVVASDGRIVVQRRADTKVDYPGYLDCSAGGQVPSGMTYEQAAVAELAEELNCPRGPLVYIGDYGAYSVRQRENRRLFLHRCDGPYPFNTDEVAAVELMTVTELATAMLEDRVTEGFRRSLMLYLDSEEAKR